MSVSLYDRAIADKIKSWVMDPNMTILYPDETERLFKEVADSSKDKPISLPLIAISRNPDININITARNPKTFSGRTFNSVGGVSDHLNAIPINLTYQLDIYTRYRAEADEYVRNFVFQLINHPRINIELPYQDCGLIQSSFIELDPTITDNSSVPERLVVGQFTRVTLTLNIKDAYLYSYTTKQIPKVELIDIYLDENGKSHQATPDECTLDTEIIAN